MTWNIKIKKLYDDVIIPEKAEGESAGYDLRAYLDPENMKLLNPRKLDGGYDFGDSLTYFDVPDKEIKIYPKQKVRFGTGISTEFSPELVMLIRLRSSAGIKKHLRLLNGTGVIDASYRGELMIFVENTSLDEIVTIKHNERIAQIVFQQLPKTVFSVVDKLNDSERGSGGFGSTNFDKNGNRIL